MYRALALVTFLGWLAVVPLAGQTPPGKIETAEQRVAQRVQELSAAEFETRDRATQALIQEGLPAIPAMLDAVRGRDREVANRAVIVLKGIGENGSLEALDAALSALAKTTETASITSVAQRAAESIEQLESVRQEQAIRHLRSLGAVISLDYSDPWLPHIPGLFSVELGSAWKGTDLDLERLAWLRDAQQVAFVGPQVKDAWIAPLVRMPSLFSVKVKHATISVEAVERLSQVPQIRFLRLMFLPQGDELISPLEKSQNLLKLLIVSKALSDQGVERLKARFDTRVECPRGALLGVRADPVQNWSIMEVIPGSAADKAGIQIGDRIVKFNDQAIGSFPELRERIGKCQPGDSAQLGVERGSEQLSLKVSFGELD